MCIDTEHAEAKDVNPVGGGIDEAGMSARLAGSVTSIAGVRALAPGLRDLVATATAKVLRRAGGEPIGIDVTAGSENVKVRIDAHLDDGRSVARIVDEIFAVVEADIAPRTVEDIGALDVDLRIVSRG